MRLPYMTGAAHRAAGNLHRLCVVVLYRRAIVPVVACGYLGESKGSEIERPLWLDYSMYGAKPIQFRKLSSFFMKRPVDSK